MSQTRQQRRAAERRARKQGAGTVPIEDMTRDDLIAALREEDRENARLRDEITRQYEPLTPDMEQRNHAAVDACLRGEVVDVCPGIRLLPADADVSSIPEFTATTKRTDVGPEGVRLSFSSAHIIFTVDAFKEAA